MLTDEEIGGRLAQFVKPEHMPVTPKQLSLWVEEAVDNGGYIEVPGEWAISGHTELFRL